MQLKFDRPVPICSAGESIGDLVAFYTLEATGEGKEALHLKTPLTARQAYARTVNLRHQGFTDFVAIDTTTGRRITNVQRLLRDLL